MPLIVTLEHVPGGSQRSAVRTPDNHPNWFRGGELERVLANRDIANEYFFLIGGHCSQSAAVGAPRNGTLCRKAVVQRKKLISAAQIPNLDRAIIHRSDALPI